MLNKILAKHRADFPFEPGEEGENRNRYYFLKGWLGEFFDNLKTEKMENVVFTQLTIPEFGRVIQQESERFHGGTSVSKAISKRIYSNSESIDFMPVSQRVLNALITMGVKTIGDARGVSEASFCQYRNISRKSWLELKEFLESN